MIETLNAVRRVSAAQIKLGQFLRHRPRPQTEFEPSSRCLAERDGLLGKDGWVSKGVAQHQMTETQAVGFGGHPCGDRHRLPDGLLWHSWSLEMIKERHPVETAGLRCLSPGDEISNR